MLISAELNFGKHVGLTFVFEEGVTIVRGANESGKTTLVNGIAYNWFGTGVLPYELEHYIPEGAKKSALKTRTVFRAQGDEYTCSRGASGAELRRGSEVIATNHAAVTTKIEELLGVPPGKAKDTMYAAQGGIRGVLELGPTQVAGFIERVAGFEQVDQLLQELGEKLVTGSTKSYEEQLQTKREQLNDLPPPVASDISFAQLEDELYNLKSDLTDAQQAAAELKAELKGVAEQRHHWAMALARLDKELTEVMRVRELQAGLQRDVDAAAGAAEVIAAAAAQIEQHNAWLVYRDFLALPQTDEVWDGDEASLLAEVKQLQGQRGVAQVEISRLQAERRAVEARRLTSTVCPITKRECGELTDKALIEQTNREIDQQLQGLDTELSGQQVRLQEIKVEVDTLIGISALQDQVKQWLTTFDVYVTVAKDQVPWGAIWQGPAPVETTMPAVDIAGLQRLINAAEKAHTQLQVLVVGRAPADIQQEIDTLSRPPSSDSLQARLDDVERHRRELEVATKQNEEHQFQLGQGERSRQEAAERLSRDIAGLEAQIVEIQENNDLVKAVKAARLQVSEMLWSKVLTGVSAYFSRMRGVESLVERNGRGFVINGTRAVSGSTYDILALALRITILKLFSQCPLMIIDEGNSGSDQDRSAAMVGVLGSCGLDQVLFVTHKDVDEAAGVNLIEL